MKTNFMKIVEKLAQLNRSLLLLKALKFQKCFRALRFEKIVNVKNIKYEILFKIVANPLLS